LLIQNISINNKYFYLPISGDCETNQSVSDTEMNQSPKHIRRLVKSSPRPKLKCPDLRLDERAEMPKMNPLQGRPDPDVANYRKQMLEGSTPESKTTTPDLISHRAISSVHQLLYSYSARHPADQIKDTEPVYENSPRDPHSQIDSATPIVDPCLVPTSNSAHPAKQKCWVEASRKMLERNLERLIAQQGMDAITQLTYTMTPGLNC